MLKLRALACHAAAVFAFALPATAQYKVNNLLSDGSVPATATDPNFLNPWGVSASGTWWISTANSGFNYVVPSTTATATPAFKVIVPTAAPPNTAAGLPAGSVTTAGSVGFNLSNGSKASFIFSTLDGTISGWNSKLGTSATVPPVSLIAVNNAAAGASYSGLALLNIATNGTTSKSYLLASNFGQNSIDVFDSNFAPTKLAGNFTDPNLPAGYAPFSVHVIGSQVFVDYALRTATAPFFSVNGAGNGVVSVFDTAGNFVSRVATAGNLNAPWGIAIAPANFGIYSNDLLIGNFGDGHINVYDPKSFSFLGQLMDSTGKPLTYASLWELLPGGTTVTGTTAVSGGDASTVFFTAGLDQEKHGLFAGITSGATAGATPTFAFSTGDGALSVTAGSAATTAISLAPVNGFNGPVSLACSGLPTSATCTFSPAQMTVSSTAPSIGSVSIQTTKASASLMPFGLHGVVTTTLAAAFLLPFATMVGMRRRGMIVSLFGAGFLLFASVAFITGCSDNGSSSSTTTTTPVTPPTPATPTGTSNVTITATAGSVTQTTTVALTVK